MVWWWQVLAVAFRGHWAALASSGAARAAYHATALRHSATRVDHTSKQQVGGWLALNNKQEDVATTHPWGCTTQGQSQAWLSRACQAALVAMQTKWKLRVVANWDVTTGAQPSWFHSSVLSQQPLNWVWRGRRKILRGQCFCVRVATTDLNENYNFNSA